MATYLHYRTTVFGDDRFQAFSKAICQLQIDKQQNNSIMPDYVVRNTI